MYLQKKGGIFKTTVLLATKTWQLLEAAWISHGSAPSIDYIIITNDSNWKKSRT